MKSYNLIPIRGVYICLIALAMTTGLVGCQNRWEGETVETSYRLPEYPDPSYKFARNGTSSVDYYECEIMQEPLDIIYNSYLREARVASDDAKALINTYLSEGMYGLFSPLASVAVSSPQRTRVVEIIRATIEASARLSGFGTPQPNVTRNKRAEQGAAGYIGAHIGDDFICFATEDGLVPAEYFRELIRGSIYLDKILNVHLSSVLYAEGELRTRHERTFLPDGHNYTELEHHWDLAYGYYTKFWAPLITASNSTLLKQSRIKLYNAFARGRWALTEYRYDIMQEEMQVIRTELSRVAAVRALQLLQGQTTMVNYREDPRNALYFLSQGLGALYSLQFTCDAEGKALLSYDEVTSFIQQLLSGDGLWNKDQLPNQIQEVATEVAKRYQLPLAEIK